MTKISKIFQDECLKLAQRDFDLQETLKLLILTNPTKYFTWGVERKIGIHNKLLLLKVNGHHHQGWVLIRLSWNDTYSFYLFDDIREIKYQQHEVYFDELQDAIDLKVEYINNYEF